jgi:hypothetical protein
MSEVMFCVQKIGVRNLGRRLLERVGAWNKKMIRQVNLNVVAACSSTGRGLLRILLG